MLFSVLHYFFLDLLQKCARILYIYNFTYLFMAVLGLRCCIDFCGEQGLLCSCGVRASHSSGFCWWSRGSTGAQASVVVAPRLYSTGSIVVVKIKVTQSCPTLCHHMDHTVHGILQARILEWVAFPFSRGSSQPRDCGTRSPALQADSLPAEPPGKPNSCSAWA